MAKQQKAQKIYEWYQQIRRDTLDWREWRDRCKKAYFGNQWETDVADRLRSRGQVDVVINILRTLIRNRVSSMIASKPTGRIYGVKKGDMVTAEVLQDFMDWHWYNSNGQIRAERVAMAQQREGVGYFVVYMDPKADYGRGEIKVADENWRHVWIPKTSGKEWDCSDAPYMILSKLLTEEEFYRTNPNYKGKLTPDFFHPNDEIYWSGQREHEETDTIDFPQTSEEQSFIREFDTYERFFKDVRVLYHTPTGTVQVIDDDYTPNDNENELINAKILKELIAPVPRIRWSKSYGEKVFRYEEIIPIEYYPIIPVPDEDTGNSLPLGEIDQTFGLQELLNKFFSLVVLSSSLASNPKVLIDAARAGVRDLNQLREDFAVPGSLHDLKMDAQTGKFPIEVVRPEPLNPAYYPLFERMIQLLQFGTATFSSKLGDTTNAPRTYSATLQYGEWQQDNIRIPLSRLEMGIQRVFDIILQWSPEHYTFHKVFDVVKENEVVGQGSVNEPFIEKGVWKTMNDIAGVKARFRIRMGSTMPAQSMAYLTLFKELAQNNPVFLKYMVDYLPIKEKEKLSKELDLVQQLSGQLQQKQSELNTVSGMLQNTLRQQTEAEIKQDAVEAKNKIDKIMTELEIELKKQKAKTSMVKPKEEKK